VKLKKTSVPSFRAGSEFKDVTAGRKKMTKDGLVVKKAPAKAAAAPALTKTKAKATKAKKAPAKAAAAPALTKTKAKATKAKKA